MKILAKLTLGAFALTGFFIIKTPQTLAETTIPSFPYTASTTGETYIFTGDLTLDSGTAITIGADNVIIDCQNHTINFAQTAVGVGINVDSYNNVEIKNCTFSTACTAGGANPIRHIFLGTNGASGTYIHHNTFNVYGRANSATGGTDLDDGIVGHAGTGTTVSYNTFNQSGYDREEGIQASAGVWTISNNTFIASNHSLTSTAYPFFIRPLESFGGGTISDNTFTVNDTCTDFYPIGAWNAMNVNVLRNTFNYSGTKGRIINPDNGSAGWLIQDNAITVNSTTGNPSDANIYGIRYRNANASGGNCGGQHTIEYNTIDCSNYSGPGNCFAMSIGGYVDTTDPCYMTDIRHNYFKGRSGAVHFDAANPSGDLMATDQDIYCNKIESTSSSGYPVVIGVPGYTTLAELTDVKFSNNEIISTNNYKVYTPVAWGSNVTFCGSGTADVTGGGSVGSETLCQDGTTGCYSDAGVRTTPIEADTAPAAPQGLSVN